VDWLGVPFDCIDLIQGDTDVIPIGGGSHSGRSMRLAGIVIGKAADAVIARGKRIAGHLLEAAEHDIEFKGGSFTVKGPDRSLGRCEAARAALGHNALPSELAGPLAAEHDETVRVGGFPYGSHVCEVEIDLATGAVEIVGYAAVDDVGRAINPRILHGQSHGAIAQGVGQALREACVYDRASGQLRSGSFLDYAIPRALDLAAFKTAISEVHASSNPLGVRAGGEGGTTPALAVVVNAIVDALDEFGVEHLDMPVTPERVWRATSRATVQQEGGNRMSDHILTGRKGPVLEITLNRPEIGNAASDAMAVELTKLLFGAGETAEIVVLRGAGEDFCVGRETMGKRPPGPPPEAFDLRRRNDVVFNCYGAFRRCESAVIGVVKGRAFGFGCAIAAVCDITLAADTAKFQVPEMAHNIMPTMVMSALVDRVPRKAMTYLVWSTAVVSPARAREAGI